MPTVLGVEVDDRLVRSWCEWLAPAVQPFFVDSARSWPEAAAGEDLSPELRDTYRAWRLESPYEVVWLDEPTFMGIARGRRRELVRCQVRRRRGAVPSVRGWSDLIAADSLRAQADGHRFVWWPSLLRSAANDVLSRMLAEDTASSRHGEVPERTWRACERVLPFARAYAGTFPAGSGPNCFGTVMAAAGVADAADEWMQQDPFVRWLGAACRRGGDERVAGTVLVWRDRSGLPVHAAVTLGEGWALEKPSQTWMTPRAIVPVDEVLRANRAPGQRLERHKLRTVKTP